MGSYYLCLLIFRIILPVILGACIVFRPSGLSAIYLLFLLYLPFAPIPTTSSMSGHTGIYLKVMIGISVLTAVGQLSFQIALLAMPPYGYFIKNGTALEKILRHVGFVRLDSLEATAVVTWISPEVVMLVASVGTFIVCHKLLQKRSIEVAENEENLPRKAKAGRKKLALLVAVGKYAVLVALCVAAVLRPSVQGGLYFLVFLSAATWWACYKQLGKGFAIIMRCLLVVVVLHMFALYAYQLQWVQDELNWESPYARYFGLTPIFTVNATTSNGTIPNGTVPNDTNISTTIASITLPTTTILPITDTNITFSNNTLIPYTPPNNSSNSTGFDPRKFRWVEQEWATYVNPIALFLLYYVLVLESKFLLKPQKPGRRTTLGETTPLIRGVSPSTRRYGSAKKGSTIHQDSSGSVTVTGDNPDDIQMNQLGKGTSEEDYNPTLLENIMFALDSFLQLIIKSSYVVTNIIMMAWSITYLSWITFVLLLWANLLWLVPNQRKSMLRSSPFLVIYAWFLLISAYIYSMDLNDNELPSSVQGFNLAQIGFKRVTHLPCNPLFVKCLFTAMFWITLRQYMQERIAERQSNALADMVAPLQVTVGTAAGVTNEQEQGSKFMDKIGKYVKKLMTKFWIWVVAITLFAVAITGETMTGFRIIYMALFLIFVLTFQVSFRAWRRMMFGFWLTVILFSMIILVMVYTYQFDHFKEYWRDYLHVPEKQQMDIGLEKFDTKQLFVRLVTPTFFVIITVVQLHYFHKDFMEMSDPKNASVIGVELDQSSLQGGVAASQSEKDDTITSSLKYDLTDTDSSRTRWKLWHRRCLYFLNIFYLFLELHMPKFVLLFLMLVCVYDKCAVYILLIILIVLACTIGRPMQIFAIYCSSFFVSLMLLARMIYQIEYIDEKQWNVTCEVGNTTENQNNTKWLGFYKADKEMTLPHLVKWNIVYILVVTLWSVVLVRQFNYRVSRGKPTVRAFFMFPKISRNDADKDVFHCIAYLFNYGFYKFGVEICLMATVGLIGFRMDMYSVVYSIWLCILFNLKRETLAKVWNCYMAFIALFLPIQYFMAVGLPPTLCILYPWDKEYWGPGDGGKAEIYRRVQDWAYLLDTEFPPSPKKLICDFILLLLVSRQSVVFRIEKRHAGQEYRGGSNDSIIHHAEHKDFLNPVPDFISTVRSYLDVFKKGVFSSFLWVTLAIVFLAGTNRVNLFSIGYLIGAFIFLWQGTDLYLKPIPKILNSWNLFLGYNVGVILIKTALQIVGCIYLKELPTDSCWIIQLLGIGCVRKFGDLSEQAGHVIPDTKCKVPREFVGLVWDGLCFGFMIIQRRLFQSYYFFHMIDEIKAGTILASRGAELIEELRLKRMTEQEEQERRVLEKIKAKMDKIKANQQKIQGTSYKDSDNHYIDTIFKGRPKRRRREPQSYKQAVRSGDYYMFDDLDDDEDLDFMEDLKAQDDEEYQGQTVGQIDEHEPKSVKIVDDRGKDDDPQPSTSKDEDDLSDMSDKQQNWRQRLWNYILFVWAFIQSSLVSLTNFLNQYSRDYRYVIRVLTKEKKILKENTDYSVGLRIGSGQVWQPSASYNSLLRQSRRQPSHLELDEYEGTEMSSYDQPPIVRLFLAIWYIIMSRSEVVCYFIIFLNQIKSATFLSLPLPLMVFLWGTLTIPRPNKTFWVTIIAYTEIIVLIKCMFQFDIIPWNMKQAVTNNPFYPPRIIGIERNKNYAVWDLLLLLVVFFHRFMLKSMGLWKASPVPAALVEPGDYKVTSDGKLEPVSDGSLTKFRRSSKNGKNIIITSSRSSPTRASDLQRLVEETEDGDDDRRDGVSSGADVETEMGKTVTVHSEIVEPMAHLPESLKLAAMKYGESFKVFFKQLKDPTSRVAADVYSYMFLCDFYNFFVILIGYSSFGTQQGDGGVSSYLEDNRVPVLFLLMLILQFTLIIVDRGIFLRKNILAKIIFQFIQVFILHIWLFIIFPIITERGFNTVIAPQMYYMVKCFYLLLSAYQIRCGYPTRILGNFLCKGYNYVNMFLFKGFMAIPFLFELRTVMDWMWTDTSMTVFDWIKMEDIFAHIFQLKCTRHVEDEFPQPRGEKKAPVIKYIMGGAILALIIAIIWFPLVFFSLGNAVGEANPPYDVTLELRIGPYEPVYQMSAQSNSIFQFTESNFEEMQGVYSQLKRAATFISNYEANDVAAVRLSSDSANIWSISPPDRQRMVEEVNSSKPLSIRLEYKVSHRTSKPEDSGVIPDNVMIQIPAMKDDKPNPMRQNLLKMLEGDTNQTMLLEDIMPKFLKVTNRGTAKPIAQLMQATKGDPEEGQSKRSINLSLGSSKEKGEGAKEWWKIQELCNDENYDLFLKRLPYRDCNSTILYTFNDKIFPDTLSILTGGGIVGLYTTLVFVASRFLRGFFADQCFKIMFEDMPNIDRVLQLCLDIYLVREAREFALEEDLFAKLVFLFRSPETMIKWTRPKEELADDEDPEGDA